MLWVYFDASALVKRYAQEIGSPLVNELFGQVHLGRMTCSTLSIPEIISILVRKRNDNRLSQALFEQAMIDFRTEVIDCADFRPMPTDDTLLFSALNLIPTHNLNAVDAIILRSALDLQVTLRTTKHTLLFCASDQRLVRAARLEALSVFDPEQDTLENLRRLIRNVQVPTGGRM